MTKTHRNFGRLVTLNVLLLTLLGSSLVARVAAETSATLSKKELKTLLATAKTPADHQQLAAYYRDQAERLRAKSQEFSAQADYLATQPATIESKQGISCNCTSHYRYFAKQYAEQAKEYEALSARHEQLTQDNSTQK